MGSGKMKRMRKIVATMSLPAVDRLNADHWNAARSCQYMGYLGTHLLVPFYSDIMQNLSSDVFAWNRVNLVL